MSHSQLNESSTLDLHVFLHGPSTEPTPGTEAARTGTTPSPAGQRNKPATDTRALFARFPHLAQLESIWGSQECRDFIAGLILDSRQGARQGFPADHASTIFRLLLEHDTRFPELEASSKQAWGFGRTR